MSIITVQGLRSLKGEIKIQGSKNAVLPMMAAAILHRGITVIANVPRIQDVRCMMGILEYMGCGCEWNGHELTIDASEVTCVTVPEDYVNCMRSSIMVLGALLGRMGEASTRYPGGCSIGKRPIDLHLKALEALGAVIREEDGVITACAPHLAGAAIHLSYPSVGATENALLASVLAEGVTVIRGAAKEPEIQELCRFLNGMGARIYGLGGGCLTVEGVKELHDSRYTVMGDRIVAGTYLTAVMAAGGQITLRGIDPGCLGAVVREAERMGAVIRETGRMGSVIHETGRMGSTIREAGRMDSVTGGLGDGLTVICDGRPRCGRISTGPYPAFPTDLQSPMLSVMAVAEGESRIEERVFEDRFGTAEELWKLGADIALEEGTAVVRGHYPLNAGTVTARDLRGGAALVVAGLAAEGETVITGCGHISRGYEDICEDLKGLGADIRGS